MKTKLAAALLTVATLLTASTAMAQGPQTRSGLLLGIYGYGSSNGLKVNGFIPGYTARDVLRRGDSITGVASDNAGVFHINRLWDLETAKERVGAFQWASIEYYRPGQGYQYAWVQFYPVDGVAAAMTARAGGAPVQRQMKAEFRSEAQKPGARQMFQSIRRNSQNRDNNNGRQPGNNNGFDRDFNNGRQPSNNNGGFDRDFDRGFNPGRRPGNNGGSAADLFRRFNQ